MKELYFINNAQKKGVNLTVRRGVKWSLDVKKGDDVGLVKVGEETMKVAVVADVRVVIFRSLVDSDLVLQHDPTCRNYSGLLMAMKRAYPTFDNREIVTLVYYEV